ncbi:MAG: aminotransferase class I/II-fold pyridoxal phosphate-dependent enzyme [Actinobacteria bacterium]|nr:aminotransferase class I/II-fold pyridoxal phosphate-dependent enzyme [Actinomycetota bacterium]
MKPLRTFRLEEYLGEWEFGARHYLTASDAQSMSVGDLLDMGSESDREGFAALPLTYVETWGSENLRDAIAGTYERVDAAHVLAFSGAQEALFWAMQELVGPGDHAVVTVPCYQSMETVTVATGAHVSALLMRREHGWALDLDELRGLLRPTTRLVAVNYPNNPTGHVPDAETFRELVALCDERGIRLFCDEVYRGIEVDQARTLPQAADLSETALSLNVASKSYGLPGLRVGWLACRDRALLERLEKRKHYTSICNPGPSEYLAAIGLRHRDRIWARNRAVITANLPLFADFFGRWADLFEWEPPLGGCVCFPRYKGAGSVDDFCRRLLQREGVVVLPASVYYSEIAEAPTDHFRVGVGRLGAEESLEAFDRCLRAG